MKKLIKKLLLIGIKKAPNKDHKKIKLLNVFCLVLAFSLTLFMVDDFLSLSFEQFYFNAQFLITYTFINIGILLLQGNGKFLFARIVFILSFMIFTWVFCLIEPGKMVEEYFLIAPLISLTFIDNKWINMGVLILACLSHYWSYRIEEVYDNISYQIPVLTTLFIANYTILKYAQSLNKKQELLLAEQRDKVLSDKVILEKQEAELRELNEFKSHFFVNLSHEIRTPITLIKGYSNHLNLEDKKEINQEKLKIVNSQINQIEGILNNILDLSKLDANKLQIKRSTYNIGQLLNKHYSDYKALFNSKDIDFNLVTSNNNLSVKMDANLIEKAINNLLSNALKFTPKHGEVIISTHFDNDLKICFSDNGIGIPKSDLDKIFDRFYQSDNDITQSQGSGIGLSFTKSILNAHDFTIKVTSKPNINTTFTITIPKEYIIEEFLSKPVINSSKTEKSISIKKTEETKKNVATILIVDDHVQMLNYLSSILSDYNVLKAENGKEALNILKKEKIDLLVTDYMMPIMDGAELVKQIKNINLKLPIIVLTARVDDFAKLNMLRIGVDGYLNKPFTVEELLLYIKNSLNLYASIIEETKKISIEEKKYFDNSAEIFNNKLLEYIKKNMTDASFSVQDVTQYLSVSQSTLNRRIKSAYGLTTQQFILQVRLEKARDFIINQPQLTKQEVGYKVGINNTSYLFKKLEDVYGTMFL